MHPFFISSTAPLTPCDRHNNPKQGSEVLRFTEVTNEAFESYCKALTTAGFTSYYERTVAENRFATYTTPLYEVHLAFYPVLGEMRLCHGSLGYLPPLEAPKTETITTPTYTQMKLYSGGQSNVVQLTDGSYLIIDGGKMYSADRDNLLAFLYRHKPSHHPKPRIAAWLISHAHDDHMNLCMDFLQVHGNQIELRMFGYNFPDFESDIIQSATEVAQKVRQKRIKCILDKLFPTTKIWLMHSGQRLLLPGCELSVLMTWEDFWPNTMKTVNQTSFCLDMRFEGGKKLMLPTDAWTQLCDQMAKVYGNTLKSDVLQAIHHGLAGGSIPFYEQVQPEAVFWPQSPERVFSPEPIVVPDREKPIAVARQFAPNCWLLDHIERHYHHGETVTMDMKTLEIVL